MPDLILGVDTSNYTTSLALVNIDGEVVFNEKKLLPVAEGERGLRQSDALFAHTKNLPILSERLKGYMSADSSRRIVAVGYSATPRDVEGSYMPCFLAGQAVATALAAALNCPLYTFSHQSGHIMAALYSAGRLDLVDGERLFAAFHVSGGTTEILLVTPKDGAGFAVEPVGGTADINAGQAIDRTGVMMGLSFPCGREMEAILNEAPKPRQKTRISVKDLSCNLSGLENLAKKEYESTGDRALTAAYCFDFVADTLCKLTENLRLRYPDIPIIYAGGVMSNKRIGAHLATFDNTYFSEPVFSSDNAAGVALLALRKTRREGSSTFLEMKVNLAFGEIGAKELPQGKS